MYSTFFHPSRYTARAPSSSSHNPIMSSVARFEPMSPSCVGSVIVEVSAAEMRSGTRPWRTNIPADETTYAITSTSLGT